MRKILCLFPILLLGACSNSNYQDLDTWMNERMKIEKGRIEPLPKAKTFIPIPFVAKTDPFQERVPVVVNLEKNKFAPDLNRRKEPLESYPLNSLLMVGLLVRDNERYAMIKVPEGTINYVKAGNYMGANYGLITKIEDEKILIEERIKNSADEWDTRETVVNLTESQK